MAGWREPQLLNFRVRLEREVLFKPGLLDVEIESCSPNIPTPDIHNTLQRSWRNLSGEMAVLYQSRVTFGEEKAVSNYINGLNNIPLTAGLAVIIHAGLLAADRIVIYLCS